MKFDNLRPSIITSLSNFSASLRRFRLLALSILLFASGCSSLPFRNQNALDPIQGPASPQSPMINEPSAVAKDSLTSAHSNSTKVQKKEHPYSDLDQGHAPSLEDLESLFRQALAMAADDRFSLAGDNLAALLEQIQSPEAAPDSCTAQQWRSLTRRSTLLKAILVERTAFRAANCAADPILATGYKNLAPQFPDSLCPATGEPMPGIMADLLKWDNPRVEKWVNYFTGRGKTTFNLWLRRKAEVGGIITDILNEEGLPPELIYLSMIESGISPHAVSSVAAVGPWQFMAPTAKDRGLHINWWVDERKDIPLSTLAAVDYLKSLHRTFGDWSLVLAAYNSGENRVLKKIQQSANDNYWDLNLPSQTADFVPKFIAVARIGENPGKYGFSIPDVRGQQFETITVKLPTDLDLIARCAKVPASVVTQLNPGILRGATPPNMGAYPVRVPVGTASLTQKALARIPAEKRLTWTKHKVQRGETISGIAHHFGCSVRDIARVNHLKNVQLIRPGEQLLIPMPAELAAIARKRATEKGHYVPPAGYKRVSYKVKSGDSLGGIAHKLGVSLRHLRKVNNLHHTSLIHPGDRLYAYRPAKK